MVEGDGCHRVAAAHRKSLVGRKFKASSPNGRFSAGAQAIAKAGGVLLRIEVHGKNLFYFFGRARGSPTLVVHIHFGMAGAFAVYKQEEPETTPNTRLRLESIDSGGRGPPVVAHLSAMTVQHGAPAALYATLAAKLGPDPLREDADPEALMEKCVGAKKAIGLILMDQSCIAGVGNIYRSETLYQAQIHPEQPANTLTRAELLGLWRTIVRDMQAGFKSGSIWGKKKGPLCYSRTKSACGGKVKEWVLGGRNVFACAKRQRLDKGRKPVDVGRGRLRPGTAHLGKVVTAAVAEGRKRKLGESFAVQHVALKDDATLAGARRAQAAARRAKASPSRSAMKRRKGASA
mmetsp:Transcript_35006/g.88202  ORF Transcript_35006/g.88202 Transcript_35006/m.88202 type:complete len:347 (+) Transcript_35006:63-1103(+)|eukprot:CAMPEP_0115658110 /NCGR_PEP_ID=MMETSP0272-20121206/45037_1 /TAXON_ID=71861 /ORGANISM="Scrippsiella trochoidea, Strain CCMP3099" /LENGTH=346 /DNA_ID=CAMNT_0003096179 /DNA_START=49 /DNA_END=1089 /DNA_ORIENTATION=-